VNKADFIVNIMFNSLYWDFYTCGVFSSCIRIAFSRRVPATVYFGRRRDKNSPRFY